MRVYQQLQFGRLVQLKRSWHRRVLPLSPWLVAVLERHRTLLETERQLAGQKWREHGLVFPSQVGTPRKAGNLWLSWKRLQKRLGLGEGTPRDASGSRGSPHTFHDLRHTFATLALHAGVPLWKVSKLLGHRDISITLRVYGHLTPEGREDVAGRMEEVLGPRVEETAVRTAVRMFEDRLEGAVFEMGTAPLGVPGGT